MHKRIVLGREHWVWSGGGFGCCAGGMACGLRSHSGVQGWGQLEKGVSSCTVIPPPQVTPCCVSLARVYSSLFPLPGVWAYHARRMLSREFPRYMTLGTLRSVKENSTPSTLLSQDYFCLETAFGAKSMVTDHRPRTKSEISVYSLGSHPHSGSRSLSEVYSFFLSRAFSNSYRSCCPHTSVFFGVVFGSL